jgi:hypothetical protein
MEVEEDSTTGTNGAGSGGCVYIISARASTRNDIQTQP